jgi:hypothetical protein
MSRHWKISSGRHFQNGHHNTAQIQHCPISTTFHMWVDNWWPFWKWRPVEIFRCQESIRDIKIYLHMKCRWNRTMLNLCGIVVAILKMAAGRNFSMSGINSGHHYLPTYEMLLKSVIPDIEKFLPVAIFKMATTIPHKFNIVRFQR